MSDFFVKILSFVISKKLLSFYCVAISHVAVRFDYDVGIMVINQIKTLKLFSDDFLSFYNIILSHFVLANFIVSMVFFVVHVACVRFEWRIDKDRGYVFKIIAKRFVMSCFVLMLVCYAVNILRYPFLTLDEFYSELIISFIKFSIIPGSISVSFFIVFNLFISLIAKSMID